MLPNLQRVTIFSSPPSSLLMSSLTSCRRRRKILKLLFLTPTLLTPTTLLRLALRLLQTPSLNLKYATHHGLYGSGDDMIPQCLLSVGFLCHQVPGPILKSASSLTSSCSSFSISGCFLWSSLSWSPFYCIKASPYSSPPFLCPFSINTAL